MEEFVTYMQLGFAHITDVHGYDHILFVCAVALGYGIKNIRPLLVAVTAFTLGHSLTLALSVLKIVAIPAALIEAIIPITILFTAADKFSQGINAVTTGEEFKPAGGFQYAVILFFGLIHGLGFSNYLNALYNGQSIISQLLAFNLGLEAGQLLIVILALALQWLLCKLFVMRIQTTVSILAGIIMAVTLVLLFSLL